MRPYHAPYSIRKDIINLVPELERMGRLANPF